MTESPQSPQSRIREAVVGDLECLVQLELSCWPPPLRATQEELRGRINNFPSGQWVIERAGRVVGAVYSQRISDVSALARHSFRTVHALHREHGRILQLLAINVAPEEQYAGFGDQLLASALSWARSRADLDEIVAVSLCKSYGARADVRLEDYIEMRNEAGLLLDPILRFHELHGARIAGVVADYRPEDAANRGCGVLVRYPLAPSAEAARRLSGPRPGTGVTDLASMHRLVESAVRSLLGKQGAQAYAPQRALRDLGLDSLDLYSLCSLLSEQLGRPVAQADFFRYPSPAAIADYLYALAAEQPPVAADVELRPEVGQAPAGDCVTRSSKSTEPDFVSAAERSRGAQVPSAAIAVIGMACRFPGAPDLDAYWSLLHEGRDAVGRVPPGRWDASLVADPELAARAAGWRGGFLTEVDAFDAPFFHISDPEANALDPQQRILLELSRAALEHAGTRPESLAGSRTGIFVGLFTHDYEYLQLRHSAAAALGPYFSTGNSASLGAGRLAYVLGTQGPALTVDTACSSSLVAVHLACVSLTTRESDLALAAGVNLMLAPELFCCFEKAGMLSPRGRCATFAADADGYVRGEGCGVLVLKRLQDALADGDPIWGVVRGTAVNHDGASNGLTAPSGPAQERVIRAALDAARLAPGDITYLEAHGTGTVLGDAVELRALSEVFAPQRSAESPLWLGSVKTNIGHTEAAAGVAGLIKVLLAMRHRTLPKHLHYSTPSPEVHLGLIPARIPTESCVWDSPAGIPRRAGISSFGFSGTNAHVVVEEAPLAESTAHPDSGSATHLFVLSARTGTALERTARRLSEHLRQAAAPRLGDLCATLATGRSHFPHRLALVADSTGELSAQLTDYLSSSFQETVRAAGAPRKSAWMFSGQGSQYAGMGRFLYARESVFRTEIDRCDALLREHLQRPLKALLLHDGQPPDTAALIHQTDYTQPALFALEYALARQWQSWGLRPDLVMGHSVGEYVAACLAEVFTLEDGLRLITARGRLMQALPQSGAMVAVLGAEQTVVALLRELDEAPDIAAYNGPEHVVISGRTDLVGRAVGKLQGLGVRCVPLQVSHAFHSALMEPMLAEFSAVARSIRFARPRLTLCSNLTGEVEDARLATPEYWVEHVRQPVRFRQSMQTLDQLGCSVFLEVGPKPVLVGMGQRCFPPLTGERVYLPSLNASQDDHRQMLTSLGRLYTLGFDLDWQAIVAGHGGRRIPLPTYGFDRKRYWFASSQRSAEAGLRAAPRVTAAPAAPADPAPADTSVETAGNVPGRLQAEWLYETRWVPAALDGGAAGSAVPLAAVLAAAVGTPAQEDAPRWAPLLAELEMLGTDFVIAALRALGLQARSGELLTAAALSQKLAIAPRHLRLLDRLLHVLVETKSLTRQDEAFRVISPPEALPASSIREKGERLLQRYPAARVEIELFLRCGAALPQVLRGEHNPLDLLFPDGDLTDATALYEHGAAFAPASAAVGRAVDALVKSLPADRPLRVLEIGAGTGGTTAAVLPALHGRCHEYVFTDVTPFFAQRVRQRFADCPFVRFQVLDIERAPSAQGFVPGHFDVVLAANVVHATADLKQTLDHVGELLAPGGLVLLLEGSARRLWIDLIFGLTEGWWRFTDTDRRPDYPLLTPQRWAATLTEMGWQEALGVSTLPEAQALFPQALVAARAPLAPAAVASAELRTESQHFLLLADQGGTARALADRLTARGNRCTLVYAGQPRAEVARAGDRQLDPTAANGLARLLAELPPPQVIVHAFGLDAQRAADALAMEQELGRLDASQLHLVAALASTERTPPPVLRVVTRGAHRLVGDPDAAPLKQTLWGLTHVLQKEHPELDAQLLDLPASSAKDDIEPLYHWLTQIASAAPSPTREASVAYRGGRWFVPRLVRSPAPAATVAHLPAAATYLITGGFGGLGLCAARHLVALGARHLVLLGRRAPSAAANEELAALTASGAQVHCLQVDVAERVALSRVFAQIDSEMPPLRGVIHSAGIIEDRLLLGEQWHHFEKVLAAKVWGSLNLHELTKGRELAFFILFSSAMTVFPTPGQSSYVAANSFLDGLADSRRAAGLPALSIGWGPWEGLGMMKGLSPQAAQLHSFGLQAMSEQDALAALSLGIASGPVESAAALAPSVKFMRVNWSAVARGISERAFFGQLLPASGAAVEQVPKERDLRALFMACPVAQRRAFLEEQVRQLACSVMGLGDPAQLNPALGFFQQGMDSLSSMELRARLQTQLALTLASTTIFKYPSVRQLAAFVEQSLLADSRGPARSADPVPPLIPASATPRGASRSTALPQGGLEAAAQVLGEPIAVVGMGCRFPGGADSPDALWERLREGRDLTRELPADRWNADALYSPDPTAKGKIYVRRGGFLDSVDQFDADFFHLSPREAESLDPQHRLVLEVAWEALQHARIEPAALAQSLTGIFLGTGQNDYARRRLTAGELEQIDVYDGTGNLPCFAAGRLGFCLGVQGPNLVVDAACASSLVALHLACQSLRLGECRTALAGGVHLVLSPEYTVFLCRAGVLAPDGITRTFDADASGMVRGEGCGIVVLKRLADAQADGDNILALIRGSAVNHGGASGGLTVPSEQAQRDLIQAALQNSRVSPDEVGYLEAHGTGTALGDPIEVAALAAVFGSARKTPLLIGSIKTNMGHLEYAAGIAGFIKTVLMLGHGELAPHLHFRTPNPAIPWGELALRVTTQRQPWPDGYGKRIAGVSSFGMSGTNAHVILEQPPAADPLARAGTVALPFVRERHFIPAPVQRGASLKDSLSASFVGERLRLPYSQEVRFEQRLQSGSYSFFADHVLHGQVVVAGACHVAMLLAAATAGLAVKSVVLADIFFLAPLVLAPGKVRVVQVLFEPQKEEHVPVKLLSRGADGDDWQLHVTATVKLAGVAPPTPVPVAEALARFTDRQPGARLYEVLRTGGFAMGPAFRWNRWYSRREREVLCLVERPADLQQPPGCSVHPGLLDTCFQLRNLFQNTKAADPGALIDVPFHIERLSYFAAPEPEQTLYCWSEQESAQGPATSLRLFDDRGASLLTVTGLRFRQASASTLLRAEAELDPQLYHLAWRPRPLAPASEPARGAYLIFRDQGGVGAALGARLQREGHTVVSVSAGSAYAYDGHGEAAVNPAEPTDFARVLGDGNAGRPYQGVFFLWGLDPRLDLTERRQKAAEEPSAPEIAGSETELTLAALNLLKALATSGTATGTGPGGRPRLMLATRVGWAAPYQALPAGASLWGLGRVSALEHPELGCHLVDLSDGTPRELAEHLYADMLAADGETQIAYAGSTRQVARMVSGVARVAPGTGVAAPAPLQPHGTYLITGGLGAIGLGLARWLVGQGARHLVLNGRKPPSDRALEALAELRRGGAAVTIKTGDIGEPAFAQALLAEVMAQGPPLRGIFHLAGVLRDLTLLNQTRSSVAAVMRAKVAGAFNLHQLTRDCKLDHFVCFSSIAAVLGSRGQGNYAAANAFLDALVHHRRAIGLPGLCIHWGGWEGAGMAALLDEPRSRRLAAQGLKRMAFASGFAALDTLLASSAASAVVQALDWTLFPEAFFHGERPMLFAEIARAPSAPPPLSSSGRAVDELAAIRQAPPDRQSELLDTLVRDRVAAILKISSPDKLKPRLRLFDAGLDSMTALELHRDLEKHLKISLPQTLIFDYPTIAALSSHLAAKLLGGPAAGESARPAATGAEAQIPDLDALLGSINGLSEADLEKRLSGA